MAGLPVLELFDLGIDRSDQIVILLYGRSEQGCEKLQIFPRAQILVQRETARHVADRGSDGPNIFQNVFSKNRSRAFVGCRQGRQHMEQGGLSSPVRPDQAENLPVFHLKREMVYGKLLAVTLGQSTDDDGTVGCTHRTTVPDSPIFKRPSFWTAIFTAYTRFAREFRVWIDFGVNSLSDEIHVTFPGYSNC